MKTLPISLPLIVAHRGLSARYPENTLAAFRAALDVGAPMIELDVTITRDEQVVVIHDDTLDRTTEGSGSVNDVTLGELKRLDAGSWCHPRFHEERVPTLEEVLDLVAGRAMVNVEIKEFPEGSPLDTGLLERLAVDTIRAKSAAERVLVSSFSASALQKVRSLASDLALAFLTKTPEDPSVEPFCRELGAFSLHTWHRRVNRALVDRFHAAGMLVIPYTVNRKDDFERVVREGVDGVFTDDPELFLSSVRGIPVPE